MTAPLVNRPLLAPNTVIPQDDTLYITYFNQLYEDIAFSVNSRDFNYFAISITSTAQDIPNLPPFGAFIVAVSGVDSTLPTLTASLCKSDDSVAGSVAVLGSQVGTVAWAGNNLTITSTATNFQIAHDNTGAVGNFNIRILGTQG